MNARLTLITGPTRSGKSRYAESLAARQALPVTYVATARVDPSDPEWCARLDAHRARRPTHWRTIETAVSGPDLATVVRDAPADTLTIVESLGTWLAAIADECVAAAPEGDVDAVLLERTMRERSRSLYDALSATRAETIVVAEQTGWGVVAPYASARIFSSVLGRLTTSLARSAAQSYLVVSGFALDLHTAASRLDIEENL